MKPPGDLLLTLSGSFRVAEWAGPMALLNQRIVRLIPREGIESRWLLYALRAAIVEVAALGRHALVSNVALSDLRKLRIPKASKDEQHLFVKRLESCLTIKAKFESAATEAGILFQSIQAGAFRGEL